MRKAKKLYAAIALALAAMLVASAAAIAAVTFDPATGTGFVGKGDVQTAFGWNNKEMQQNQLGVTFEYIVEESVEQNCEENLGKGQGFAVKGERTKTQAVNSTLSDFDRKNKQYVGWNLTGLGTVTEENTGWVGPNGETTGNACPEGSNPRGEVRVLSSVEALYATFNGDSREIWVPPAPAPEPEPTV